VALQTMTDDEGLSLREGRRLGRAGIIRADEDHSREMIE
jgi:hypothetical protein